MNSTIVGEWGGGIVPVEQQLASFIGPKDGHGGDEPIRIGDQALDNEFHMFEQTYDAAALDPSFVEEQSQPNLRVGFDRERQGIVGALDGSNVGDAKLV